jgi:protease II
MVNMSKVIRFVRERTPYILVVYGAYIYFRSLRMASDILSLYYVGVIHLFYHGL